MCTLDLLTASEQRVHAVFWRDTMLANRFMQGNLSLEWLPEADLIHTMQNPSNSGLLDELLNASIVGSVLVPMLKNERVSRQRGPGL